MFKNDPAFYIVLNIKTANGYETIGKFFLGANRKPATNIFHLLKGKKEVDNKSIITLELVELKNELPLNMLMMTCTLEELSENCKIITREVFKLFNLEEMKSGGR